MLYRVNERALSFHEACALDDSLEELMATCIGHENKQIKHLAEHVLATSEQTPKHPPIAIREQRSKDDEQPPSAPSRKRSRFNRTASTISREIRRNGGQGCYRANQADQAAWDRAHRPKVCKLVENRTVAQIVADKLQLQWSPEQIAGWLKRTYPDDTSYQVSHETIYRTLFIQARGALKKELFEHLRRTRAMRRSRHHTQKKENHGRITDAVSIRERPAAAKDRAVPGHWEGDLLCGSRNSQIATLVERHTRYVMLVKLDGKDSETVISALIENARNLPQELYKSLTWDRGKEMADHKRFTVATDIKVYFCDPHRPWQRGSNENTNGSLRQYFPKGTDLAEHSQATLNEVARQLNSRPRKTLDYETPAERFSQSVASTG